MNSYTFHIHLYDLVLLGALFIAIDFFLLLWFARKVRPGKEFSRLKQASKPSSTDKLIQRGYWLRHQMKVNRFYRDAELSLNSLAKELNIPIHELSRIINTGLRKNFNDFVNEFRIQDVVRKMKDPAYNRMTLVGIAFDCGFNSKTTFNRAFKQVLGKTPAEYKGQLKKERPNHDLNPLSASLAVISGHNAVPAWSYEKLNRNFMFKNYLKVALRNLQRNKIFAFINIFGLAFGLACCLLMILYIRDELNYDRFNQNAGKIYRVAFSEYTTEGNSATTPMPIGPALTQQIPEVKTMVRLAFQDPYLIKYQDNRGFEHITFADKDMFRMFSLPLLSGDPNTVLKDPNSIVISEEMARKYFGNQDPIDKILNIGTSGKLNSVVKGVFKTLPQNSQFHFNCLISFSTMYRAGFTMNLWQQMPTNYTYIELNNPGDAQKLESKLPSFVKHNGADKQGNKTVPYHLILQRLTDIHLRSHLKNELPGEGNITYVYLFAAIGFIILLIACFNFLNFATANAIKRIKEIGIRKVIGAQRPQLIKQFLTESLLIYLMATIISFLFVQLGLPFFNSITGKSFNLADTLQPGIIIGLALIGIIAGLITGLFPALSIARLSSHDALKGKIVAGSKIALRKILVTTQFAASLALMVCAVVVYQQMQYVKDQAPIARGEQLIVFPVNKTIDKSYEQVKNELLANNNITGITASTNVPGFTNDSWAVRLTENSPEVQTENYVADDDFLKTMNITLLAGRSLNKHSAYDVKQGFVLNEAAVQALGFKTISEAVGKNIIWGSGADAKHGSIIGVAKDFHFRSLHEKIAPALIQFAPYDWMTYSYMLIKLKPGSFAGSINFIRKTVAAFDAGWPVDYKFFNETFESLHQKDEQQGRVFAAFTIIAILISCLGLLGLTIYATRQRMKEIGIRKVLGASVVSIVNMLSKDFIQLIMVAACIAFPLAWWAMNQWLEEFAYHIHVSWGIFVVVGISVMLMALATVSFQAIKAALVNPVKSLRSE